ncbi:serine/threonine-protein kinase [Tautonia plasticadhaerens]|uniref:non-specific serine/threonine protein kinase n=1 Tax=Tautonia plasticadhaerens TaxID=2527974 RepID=A0A518GVV6_9BACT|nr:serine/threonine-protein kinase [Tautonia plasticadhaerens]QDV32699.1 Serine/threonine-protein kinase PknH [Tautonia plasticadhaerens]
MDEIIPTQTTQTVTRLGSYRLVEPLGSGGMSSVFRAVHIDSGYEVALKVLPRYLAKNPTLLQRFLREAQSAEALEHQNIVSIYDRGSESGRHYLVLEYVEGSDLHDRVRRFGPMEVPEAMRVVREAALGLRYAWSKGVVHRDIKPANILMARDGAVKLIDLGLALQSEAEDERVTRHGTTVGTVDYMAPEQARDSRGANERSDMYSLGCTSYYLLTGFPPFPGGHIADKLRRHATQPVPDVRQLRPDVPRAVAKLIQRLMAKKPGDRFASYDALLEELDRLEVEDSDEGTGSFEFALIADEDESADFDLGEGARLIEAPSTRDVPPVADPPFGADIQAPSTASYPPTRLPRPEPTSRPEPEPEVRLSELADLLSDEEEPAPRHRSGPSGPAGPPPEPLRRGRGAARPRVAADDAFDPFSDLDEDHPPAGSAAIGSRRSYGQEASVQAWVIGGAVVGLVVALLGFAIISLIRMDWAGGPVADDGPEVRSGTLVEPSLGIDRTGGTGDVGRPSMTHGPPLVG